MRSHFKIMIKPLMFPITKKSAYNVSFSGILEPPCVSQTENRKLNKIRSNPNFLPDWERGEKWDQGQTCLLSFAWWINGMKEKTRVLKKAKLQFSVKIWTVAERTFKNPIRIFCSNLWRKEYQQQFVLQHNFIYNNIIICIDKHKEISRLNKQKDKKD